LNRETGPWVHKLDDNTTCEMKRLFVLAGAQGQGGWLRERLTSRSSQLREIIFGRLACLNQAAIFLMCRFDVL
jgi:hypothetical protein